jgi:dolichol-phosphate mannosyltransferase
MIAPTGNKLTTSPTRPPVEKKVLLSILIPSYNEEKYIVSVIEAIHNVAWPANVAYEILIIDDGSHDRTIENLERYKDRDHISVFQIPANCGKGAAVRIGIAKAQGDIVMIQDADLEYDPNDYPALLNPILTGQAKVVYGSRFLKHPFGPVGGMKWTHWLGNKLIGSSVFLLYGCYVSDEATAYKVFEGNLLRSIPLRSNGFEICPELTAKTLRRNEKILEIPIQYKARSVEQGKKIRWIDGLIAVWMLLKCRFSSKGLKK